jgi:hypothetical protein
MLFLLTLTHTPELCFAKKEYREEARQWFIYSKESAQKYNVKLLGSYVCPIEHTFYILLESDNFKSLSGFLSPPILTHHSAKITPLITVDDAFETVGTT